MKKTAVHAVLTNW